MKTFTIATDIAAPTGRIWQVMRAVERWHEWTASVTSIERLDEGALRVGSRAIVRQPKLPPGRWTVTAIDEGRSFTWVNTAPGVRIVGHHTIEPTGTGGRAMLSLEYHGMLASGLAWLTRSLVERYLELEATGLKRRSEDPAFRCART